MQQQRTGRGLIDPPADALLSTGIFSVGEADSESVTAAGIRFACADDAMEYLQRKAMQQTAVGALLEVETSIEVLSALREQLLADAASHADELGVIRDRASSSSSRCDTAREDEWDDLTSTLAVASRQPEQSVSRSLVVADTRARELPASMAAWSRGEIRGAHVRVIENAAAQVAIESRPAFDAEVVQHAVGRTPRQLGAIARRIAKDYAEHPLAERHRSAFEQRGLWVTSEPDGMAICHILTSGVIAEGIQNRLRLGFKHKSADDPRSLPQFAADTAAAMLLAGEVPNSDDDDSDDAATAPDWLRGITAHVTITMPATMLTGAEHGRAELPDGQLVDDDTALLLAGGVASFTRLFTDPVTQVAITADNYQPTLGLRRLIIGRDQCCRFPGCTRPAIHSDIDHTTAWHDGGKTSSDNLAALCRKHHTRKHRYGAGHGWQVRQTAPGVLEWLDPSGRRVTVTPEPVPTAVQLTSADTPPEAAKSQGPPGSVPEPEPRPDPWQAMEDWHVDGDDEDPPPY